MGQGTSINLWKDEWSNKGPLPSIISGPFRQGEEHLTVVSVLRGDGSWDFSSLSFVLEMTLGDRILSVPRSMEAGVHDRIVRKFSKDGKFSSKSAYHLRCKHHECEFS